MDNELSEVLSLRNIKRSQSVKVSTAKDKDNNMFNLKNRKHSVGNSCELVSDHDKNLSPNEPYQKERAFFEHEADYFGKRKEQLSCRQAISLFIFVIGVLGTSILISFICTIIFNKSDISERNISSSYIGKANFAPLFSKEQNETDRNIHFLELDMSFDNKRSDDDSEILKWRHNSKVLGVKERLKYEKGKFTILFPGTYGILLNLGIDVRYITLSQSDTLGLYICVSNIRNKIDPIRCVKSRVSYKWAGQIVIEIPRMFFHEKDVLVATLTSDKDVKDVKQVIRSDSTESFLQIYHL